MTPILVAYTTRVVPNIADFTPKFEAPANFKDPAKIEEEITKKKAAFLATAKDQPYTGTLDCVLLITRQAAETKFFTDATGGGKVSVAMQVQGFLRTTFKNAWSELKSESRPPVFVGFEPKVFLKMLGLECSLPSSKAVSQATACPLNLWYDNSAGHRDIGAAIVPSEFSKTLSLHVALKAHRPVLRAEAEKWDAMLASWPGPGVNPAHDLHFIQELAVNLGFYEDN